MTSSFQSIFFVGLTTLLIFLTSNVFSQETYSISGILLDKGNKPLSSVLINQYRSVDSSYVSGTISDETGRFELKFVPNGQYFVEFRLLGSTRFFVPVIINNSNIDLKTITLMETINELEMVTVIAPGIRVSINGDTTEYNADAYKVNPDALAIDLIEKMPGITVDGDKVQAHGEDVKKVTVDGEDYFGDDVQIALRNLPADIIDKIQVFDGQSEQAKFTGFQDPNTFKTINIVTKNPGGQLIFGKAYTGYGTDNRFNMGGNVNSFYGKRKISVIINSNNINEQNFSNEDLIGVTLGQGEGGGRPSGGGSSSSYSQPGNDFYIGSLGGINTTNSIGLNYIDRWGGKTKVSGSYFFYRRKNEQFDATIREFSNQDTTNYYYAEDDLNSSRSLNHRFTSKIEIDLSKTNQLIITPQISFQDLIGENNISGNNRLGNVSLNSSNTNLENNNFGYVLNNDILFMHSFKKNGRSLSFNMNTDHNTSNQDELQTYSFVDLLTDTLTVNDQNTEFNFTTSKYLGSANFTERLSDKLGIIISYSASYQEDGSEKKNYLYNESSSLYDAFDSSLSNHLNAEITTHKLGTNLEWSGEKTTLSGGLFIQNTKQNGNYHLPELPSIDQMYYNFLPTAMLMHRFNKQTNIRVFYRTGTNLPSISQLQNVVDNSNPQRLVKGNSNLNQEKYNMLITRFAHTNLRKGRSFFAFLMLQQKSDYIGQNLVLSRNDTIEIDGFYLLPNTQLSEYKNFDQNLSSRSVLSYGFPLKVAKSNLNINAGANFSLTPGETNSVLNTVYSTNVNGGFVLGSNISESIDFTLSYSYNHYWITNSTLSFNNSRYAIQKAEGTFNFSLKKRLVFGLTSTLNMYTGISNISNNTPILLNSSIAYKFLKDQQLEIRITAFDILNQNTGIARLIQPTFTENTESMVLNRYLMIKASYRFRST